MNAIVLFTAEVFGVLLRVLDCQGKRWLCADDMVEVFEYRNRAVVMDIFYRARKKLDGHSVKAKIDGKSQSVRIFDEAGLRYFVERSPRPGALHLLRWLDAGGLQSNSDDVIPFDGNITKTASAGRNAPKAKSEIDFAFDPKPKSENVFVFEPHHKRENILAFSRPKHADARVFGKNGKSASAGAFEFYEGLGKQELYCVDLLRLLLDHSGQVKNDDVADNLIADIQGALIDLIDGALRATYSPELNKARYELYSSYWLQGDGV